MQFTNGNREEGEKMRIAGYKLNGYNATYEKCVLDIKPGINADNKRVLEVTDILSGITYLFETDIIKEENVGQKRRKRHAGYPKKSP